MFIRAMKSLNPPYTQRANLLSLMEGRGFSRSLANLRNCSILLMGAYKGLDGEDDRRGERKVMAQSCGEEEEMIPESHVLETGDDVWIVRRCGKKGRPGLASQALRETAAGVNVRMDSSTVEKKVQLQRYLCGSKEHSLRTCPEPFALVLSFPTKKPDVEGVRFTQCEVEGGDAGIPEQEQGGHVEMTVQETNLASQSDSSMVGDVSQTE